MCEIVLKYFELSAKGDILFKFNFDRVSYLNYFNHYDE